MVRMPDEMCDTTGKTDMARLAAIEMATKPAMTLFLRPGGMIIAKNMPYRPTPSALTTWCGRILPTAMPTAVPMVQAGMEIAIMP